MPSDVDLTILDARVSTALEKVGAVDRDTENLYDQVSSLKAGVEDLNHKVEQSLTMMRNLSNELLDLRHAVSPGSNLERVTLIFSGAAVGSALVSFMFHLFVR